MLYWNIEPPTWEHPKRQKVKCGPAGMWAAGATTDKMQSKVRASPCGWWVNCRRQKKGLAYAEVLWNRLLN